MARPMSTFSTQLAPPPSRSSKPLVELRGVDVIFGRNHVLRGINLSIQRGQTLGIIGESGCGKTVMLKTIIGLIKPTRGEVLFDGKNLFDLSEQELTRE